MQTGSQFKLDDVTRTTNNICQFDEWGYLTSYSEFFESGKTEKTKFYNYRVRLTDIKEVMFYEEMIIINELLGYNAAGKLSEVITNRNDELMSKLLIEYPDAKTKIETKYDSDGKVESTVTYNYDDKKNLLYEKGQYGEMDSETFKTYDANGNMLSYRTASGGVTNAEYAYTYTNNKLTKEVELENGKPISTTTYEYKTENGLNITSQTFKGVTTSFAVDEQGNTVKYEEFENGVKNTYTYKYTYDAVGNWTGIIEYKNGTPLFIRERVFEYYQ